MHFNLKIYEEIGCLREIMIFCTLFDSYYIDKGIALYNSLERVSKEFTLYIFCFDDKSFEILKDMSLSRAVILHHSCFETEEYLEKKKGRSKAEYCWTCTSRIIEYVLDNYDVEDCTYIDSDLYFYENPKILKDEIDRVGADVTIVEHRFKSNRYGRKLEKRNGKYCVQFNFFRKNENARKVLNWWKERCLEWCYDIPEPDRMGDQKYLNCWTAMFEGVHELQHLGGGVAPWNLEKYTLESVEGYNIIMKDGKGKLFPLVFYHFQNIRYMPGRYVNIKSQTRNRKLKYAIYVPYLKEIELIRDELERKYGLDFNPKKLVRSSNPVVGFLQRYFASLKVQHWSDIMNLDELEKY